MSSGFCSRCHEISRAPYNCPRAVTTGPTPPTQPQAKALAPLPFAFNGTKKQDANGEEPIQGGHTAIRAKIGRPNLAPKGDPDRGLPPAAPAPKEAKAPNAD